jgi:hypothetical protein
MRRSTSTQGDDGGRSHHSWSWKKTSLWPCHNDDEHGAGSSRPAPKSTPKLFARIMLTRTSPRPAGMPRCRAAFNLALSYLRRAASGHSQARSSAVTCPCVVKSAHTICRSSAPPATASQDTYRAAAIALSKNRQTAFSSGLIDTAPFRCPRPCISPPPGLSERRLCLCRHHTFSADPLCRAYCETRICWYKQYSLIVLGYPPLKQKSTISNSRPLVWSNP